MVDIVRQLEVGALLHVDGQRGANVRHRSLHSTVEWSYRLLPAETRALLRRLAVFQGGATLELIVEACTASSAQDHAAVAELLDSLVSTSLVAIERVEGGTRYRLLETVRAFAVELLDDVENDEIRERHLRAMIDWARRMRDVAEGPDPAPAFKAIHIESANLRAAVEWCKTSGDHAAVLEMVAAMGPFLARFSGAIAEIEEWVELALTVDEFDHAHRVDALLVGAFAARQPDEVELARASEARHLASSMDDPRLRAFTAFAVGDVRIDGSSLSVEPDLRSAIDIAEAANLFPVAGGAINSLANFLIRQLRFSEAAELLTPRAALSARYGYWEPFILYHHARLAMEDGELEQAEAGFDAAMRAAERTNAVIGLAYAWFGKGTVAENRSDPAAARECIERSLVLDEQLNDRHEVLNDRHALVVHCLALDDLDAARTHGRALGELAAFNPGPREIGVRHEADGLIAVAEGRLDEGRAQLLDALRAFAPTQMTDIFLHALERFPDVPPTSAARMTQLVDDVADGRRTMHEVVDIVEELLAE